MKSEQIHFCIRCAAPLERRVVFGIERPACPACGWVYFEDPKVAVGVLVLQGDAVLLVKRNNEPARGLWSIPAGFMDAGEHPERAAERECLEETGLQTRVSGLAALISGREHERGADILLVYCADRIGGTLSAGDDADAAQFFPREFLPPLAFRATRIALGLEPATENLIPFCRN